MIYKKEPTDKDFNIKLLIFIFASLLFKCSFIMSPVVAAELRGIVIEVQGDKVTIKVESTGTAQPAVGDMLDIIESVHGGIAAFDLGDWIITEVNGKIVKAEAYNLTADNQPKVNSLAIIHLSPGNVNAGEPPIANSKKKSFSTAKGKVIMTRGKDVTIQLDKGHPQVSVGDVVELSFTAAGVVISVGTWRISDVKRDGVVEAKPLEPEGEPGIDMDARVFTDPSKQKVEVDSKKIQDRTVKSKLEDGGSSPLETACLNGDANACNKLGVAYATGKGVTQSQDRAVEFYRKACDGGVAKGCLNLAYMYRKGHGVGQDYRLAADYYRKGCEGGNAEGCYLLGYMYRNGNGVDQDNRLAADYYRKGCDGGHARGCTYLGINYRNGYGVDQDNRLAVDYYRKGCDGGHAQGCTNLGYMYRKGYGVDQDNSLAADYYRKGCRGGHAGGCSNLGYMYEKGYGVNKDYKMATNYYQKGCDGGNGRGCTYLGINYRNGYGVDQDNRLAVDYYRKGCDGGHAQGCGNLGWAYYQGRGTTTNRDRGKKLLEQACEMGHSWSCDRLKEIEK